MTSAEYRDFAEYCMDLAERASPSTSMKLHHMAEIWLDLAVSAATSPRQATLAFSLKKLY